MCTQSEYTQLKFAFLQVSEIWQWPLIVKDDIPWVKRENRIFVIHKGYRGNPAMNKYSNIMNNPVSIKWIFLLVSDYQMVISVRKGLLEIFLNRRRTPSHNSYQITQ